MPNILLSQAGPAFTANPVKRYAGHKDGVWEVKVIHHKSLKVKKKNISAKAKGSVKNHHQRLINAIYVNLVNSRLQ